MDKLIVISGDQNIRNCRILSLRAGLRLECKGLHRRGQSIYSIVKQELGFKGNKESVLAQLNKYIEQNIIPPQGNDPRPVEVQVANGPLTGGSPRV
jgi:hypothetical protein